MYVEQLENKNQFVIMYDNRIYFQSYKSLIAQIDNENELTLYNDWDYSKTTLKHLKIFMQRYWFIGKDMIRFENKPFKKQIETLIKNGIIIRGY